MKGYKGFSKDMSCHHFQYEQGKTYYMEGSIVLCQRGFHFCKTLRDCFRYYDKDNSIFCEVEANGDIINGDYKSCCSEITIGKKLSVIDINRIFYSDGNGDGNGYGYDYYGDGNGCGYGNGYGYGYSYGYGNGYGYGYGYGDNYGDNIQKVLNFMEV